MAGTRIWKIYIVERRMTKNIICIASMYVVKKKEARGYVRALQPIIAEYPESRCRAIKMNS